jgi:hypothetical protein
MDDDPPPESPQRPDAPAPGPEHSSPRTPSGATDEGEADDADDADDAEVVHGVASLIADAFPHLSPEVVARSLGLAVPPETPTDDPERRNR